MITFNYVPKRSHFAYVNGQIHSYYKFFFIIFTKIFLTIILRRHIQLKALYNNWSLYIYLYSIGTGTLVCFLDFVSHSLIIMIDLLQICTLWAQALFVCDAYFLLNSMVDHVMLLHNYHI